MAEPKELTIKYSEIVSSIQDDFIKRGKMKPVELKSFLGDIGNQVEAYREVYGNYLRVEWSRLFPGVSFSEELLLSKLDEHLEKKRLNKIAEFKQYLRKKERLSVILNWVFRTWDIRFLVLLPISVFVSFPFFAWLTFVVQNNWMFRLGGLGLIANLVLLIVVFFKTSIFNFNK